jgi:uncharacterized membrane protein YebE (DUF533 family)
MRHGNEIVTSGTVGAGGLLAYVSHLDWASWSYIVGIIVALVGLAGGFYWQWRKDRRAEEVHKAILESIKAKGVVVNEEHELD